MKVLILVILVVGSSSGLGSGPYLPSGWKPSGRAFYLPTEIEKPVAIPLKDVPVQETESSGSAFLREYGPPKVQVEETDNTQVQVKSESSDAALRDYESQKIQEVSQDITQQALPVPITEQAFIVIDTALVSQNEDNAEIAQAVVTKETASDAETTTEVQSTEEQATQSEALIEGRTEVESQTESSLIAEEGTTETLVEITEAEKIAKVAEITQEAQVAKVTQEAENIRAISEEAQVEVTKQETENINNVAAAIEEKIEEVAEVRAVESGVKNIADALVNLENEIIAQQVQTNEEVTELRTFTQGSTLSAPEGFLEYGPPGFAEYGPPKGDLKFVPTENLSDANEINNETRRRRFSPKFSKFRRSN